jgi:hypothetical protein
VWNTREHARSAALDGIVRPLEMDVDEAYDRAASMAA